METIKEVYPGVERIEIDVHAEPMSVFSSSYNNVITLLPDDELKLTLKCPNGSCTNGWLSIPTTTLLEAVRKAITSNSSFRLVQECDGWEDETRIGRFRCGTKYTIEISCLQRNHEA